VHDNERRWRVTRERTQQLIQAMTTNTTTAGSRTTSTETADTGITDTGITDTGKASGAGEQAPVGHQESPS
jgi:hypothetical protein